MSEGTDATLETYGPAMAALTERQRHFVLAMASDPLGNAKRWALAAGYSQNPETAKTQGSRLLRDPRIEAAVFEVARTQLNVVGPLLATTGLLRMARNTKHPKHARAVELIANRVGLHEVQEVRVHRTDQTGAAMVARIKALAAELGMDASQLLGVNAPKLIDGNAKEVSHGGERQPDHPAGEAQARPPGGGQESGRQPVDGA